MTNGVLQLPALAPDPGDLIEPPPREFKRLLATGDWHVGHHFGLTPPVAWESQDPSNPRRSKRANFQRALWGFLDEAVEPLRPIDILELGGDAIDGKGERSGGVEQITTNRNEQAELAAAIVDFIAPAKVRIVYGTRYHTGKDEDFEDQLVDKITCTRDVTIQGHGFYDVNGCIIDSKHKLGSSGIPHGRHTALARARLWNVLWNQEHGRQPLANILLRHHVHYHTYAGGRGWLATSVPPLCYGTAYGIRECEALVDVGMIKIDIYKNGSYTWQPIFANFPELKASVESL